ncbi:hypothetical protein BDV93DRAFT_346965 [Ceratobasidium sp. AG-I]|nr:hypothetical protein BDV93DRAFT_346965 [Ceratobasidium sp. AG-I]
MNGMGIFSSPPKEPPKVQVGHPPLPHFKEVQEEHILEVSGPASSFQEDQLRDALEALCDRLNGRDAGYFFDSSGVRTFMVLDDLQAVDAAIANRDTLIVDPIHPNAQEALSSLNFSRATESFELRAPSSWLIHTHLRIPTADTLFAVYASFGIFWIPYRTISPTPLSHPS